jgi:hypothetical protein
MRTGESKRERLAPEDPSSAPIVVSFSAFPGVQMRLGQWHLMALPAGGCDSRHEDVQAKIERFAQCSCDVAGGRFTESIYIPKTGNAWLEAKFW